MTDGEERVRDAPSIPSPPSSASLREAVVGDFLSGVYGTVSATAAGAVAAPSALNERAGSVPALTEGSAVGVVELDTPRDNIEPSLTVSDARPSEEQQRQEERTPTIRPPKNKPAKQEEPQHQAATLACSSSTSRRSPSDVPLHTRVVQDYLSDKLSGLLPAEVEAEAAAASGQRSHATPDVPPPHDPRAASQTAAAGNVRDGSETPREDTSAILEMRNSLVETMAVPAQKMTRAGDACCASGGGEERCAAEARGGLCSPTPPGTPEEERHCNANPELKKEVPTEPSRVDDGHSPNPRSVEALAYLAEVGARAKSLGEVSRKARDEAAEWLRLTGATAKTTQDSADKARADASSWLRDTGARALSLKGGQREGRTFSCSVEARAEVFQAVSDPFSFSCWLRPYGDVPLKISTLAPSSMV